MTAVLLTALSHGVAEAAPITQTFSTSITGEDGASFVVEFDRFDPTLGTLTSVSGTLSGSFDYSMTVVVPISINVSVGESLSYLDASAQFGLVFAPFSLLVAESVAFSSEISTVSGTASDSLTKSSSLPALLAFYTGTGSVTGGVGAGPIVPSFAVVTGRTLEMTLVYNYTPFDTPGPVPEPSSLALLGLGLAGFALTRRRKR